MKKLKTMSKISRGTMAPYAPLKRPLVYKKKKICLSPSRLILTLLMIKTCTIFFRLFLIHNIVQCRISGADMHISENPLGTRAHK